MAHRVSYKVYYEDTDALSVVYYANYFKFLERGRSEYVAAHGQDVAAWNAAGVLVVVHKATATFKRPARLGDVIDVVSTFSLPSPYRGRFDQRIERDGELLVDAQVDVCCLDTAQNLIEFPAEFKEMLS
mgnify:CR=1 FL=1